LKTLLLVHFIGRNFHKNASILFERWQRSTDLLRRVARTLS